MRLIIGISGASGAVYGTRLLEVLKECETVETHLVITAPAKRTLLLETPYREISQVEALADFCYGVDDIGAPIASGSFHTDGMIVAPCSVKTLSAIANSYNDNLLVRACDVVLKERRRLVLLFRETPLHLGHLRNMERVTEIGGILLPPVPAFYHRPQTLDDVINHTVGKVLDLFGINHSLFRRWGSSNGL